MIPGIRPGLAALAAALMRLAEAGLHKLIERVLDRLADIFVDPW
jgi:hypothetical protein